MSLHQGGEVVVAKLIAPVRVIAVLKMELLSQGRCQGYPAAVLETARLGADWIVTHAVRV